MAEQLTCNQQVVGSTPITSAKLDYVVIIARRIHLFPFRTQKLSSLAPMVLGGQPPGRVGRS